MPAGTKKTMVALMVMATRNPKVKKLSIVATDLKPAEFLLADDVSVSILVVVVVVKPAVRRRIAARRLFLLHRPNH
ncbi:hypothetical protein ColKHC_05145 [Colletotrichum higginsianum]|nr:hypothetical protein ColKHC_05145 [Colletotrichum higginsianum]